jgi:uncharacterized Ntn-hydrolase superfamily protein
MRPLGTFSIAAIDPAEGQMGVAVQSHWFSAGSIVGWAEPGVGVVAIQAALDATYGRLGLAMMKAGKTPQQTLKALLAADPTSEVKQTAILGIQGRVAAHTGVECIPEAGHTVDEGCSAQANIMRNREVWPAILTAFRDSKGKPFAYRLMEALEAGQAAGGDIRGMQSSAMLIVKIHPDEVRWKEKILDLRVEDHPEPLKELRRLLKINEAYKHADNGDNLVTRGKVREAIEEYKRAGELAPQIEELRFWQAVTLLSQGMTEDAMPIFREVFAINPDWKQLLRSLPRIKQFRVEDRHVALVLGK